jgi:hypothetical protein
LNFGDFSRFAKTERDMKIGNFLGLPVNFILFAIIVVVVTAGSAKVFGHMIMEPVEIASKIDSKWAVVLGSMTFIVATMGVDIVANFVSPSYDIAGLFPGTSTSSRAASSPRSSRCSRALDLRRQPRGDHCLREHLRRGAGADVRRDGGRFLPAQEAGHRSPHRKWRRSPSRSCSRTAA